MTSKTETNNKSVSQWASCLQATPFETDHTRKRRGLITSIKEMISAIDWGLPWKGGVPHANTSAQIEAYLKWCSATKRGLPVAARPPCISRLNSDDFEAHFAGRSTFYFAGNGQKRQRFTLVMPEIDVQKARQLGSPEGALRFAEYLRDEEPLFRRQDGRKLYIERSTGGKGMHTYLVLDKVGAEAEVVNALLPRLQRYLNWVAEAVSADIEKVEVKGGCPVVSWTEEGPTVERTGTLAKIPRVNTAVKEEAFRNTIILTVSQLSHFLDKWERRHGSTSKRKKTLRAKTARSGSANNHKQSRLECRPGSVSGKHISGEELEKLPDYVELFRKMKGNTEIRPHGVTRARVRDVDGGIFFMIGKFLSENMNPNGTMPTERWAELWTALKESGDIERAWCPNRFCALRNWLSSLPGCIDWRNMTYVRPTYVAEKDGTQRKIKGRACKWQFGRDLLEMLRVVGDREEEKASLIITSQWALSLRNQQLTRNDTPRPRVAQENLPHPDEMAQFVGYYRLAA